MSDLVILGQNNLKTHLLDTFFPIFHRRGQRTDKRHLDPDLIRLRDANGNRLPWPALKTPMGGTVRSWQLNPTRPAPRSRRPGRLAARPQLRYRPRWKRHARPRRMQRARYGWPRVPQRRRPGERPSGSRKHRVYAAGSSAGWPARVGGRGTLAKPPATPTLRQTPAGILLPKPSSVGGVHSGRPRSSGAGGRCASPACVRRRTGCSPRPRTAAPAC
jgi:hypothetical protein